MFSHSFPAFPLLKELPPAHTLPATWTQKSGASVAHPQDSCCLDLFTAYLGVSLTHLIAYFVSCHFKVEAKPTPQTKMNTNNIIHASSWRSKWSQTFCTLCFTYDSNPDCSVSRGWIRSKTWEYCTLAFTQAAKGAAAVLARLAFWKSHHKLPRAQLNIRQM